MRAFSIYFGRTRSSRRNHPRTQSVPEVSGENNSPRIPILFCATSDGPIASAPCTAVAWAPPHRTHLLSLSWRHASEPWLPAALSHGRRQQVRHLFKGSSSSPTFRAHGSCGRPPPPSSPLITEGPQVYLLYLGHWQVGRSSARRRPSAPPLPQLA
jgi:hypothetical protein